MRSDPSQTDKRTEHRENEAGARDRQRLEVKPRSGGIDARGWTAVGLAASSLALIAGAAGRDDAKRSQVAPALKALEPVVEEKGGAPTWDIEVTDHDGVDFFVEYLMGKNRDKTEQWLARIGKYGPLIQNELRERGMPQDLLYLAMIESGLDPNAYSRAHAAGVWQFIAETGQRYGLEVSSYVDERRDPVKATAAALTYLQEMHDRFGSWYLAAAGYNTGENRVGRIMREQTGSERGEESRYWDIWTELPRETRDYVPLMLAMGHIAKEPAKYGFYDIEPESPLAFEEVLVGGGTALRSIASRTGLDASDLEALNPHLVRKMTPPGRSYAVRVPVGAGTQVVAAVDGAQLLGGASYAE